MTWGLIFLSALFDSYAAFIVKGRFNQLGAFELRSWGAAVSYFQSFFSSPLVWSAAIAFVAAPGLWFFALNRMDLSAGYPALVGFHLLFVFILGVFFLGEAISLNKLIAVFFLFLSLFFLFRHESSI